MAGLEEFISCSNITEISFVAGTSHHSKVAQNALNMLIASNEKYINSAYILSRFPILLWAENERERNAVLRFWPQEEKLLEVSSEIIREVNRVITSVCKPEHKAVLSAIHLCREDVSGFIAKKYYMKAAEEVLFASYDKINVLCNELVARHEKLPLEEQIAMHDIDLLFDLNKKGNRDVKTMLLDGVECLDHYFQNSKEISICTKGRINKEAESKTGELLGRSRTYVKNRADEGAIILSSLFWGLTNKESICIFQRGKENL